MRKSLFTFLLALCTGLAIAQPKLKFDLAYHDFGTLKHDAGVVSHRFNFINAGNQPLKILEMGTSCGCTTTDYTKEEIAPGDSGYIIANLNSWEKQGSEFTSSISVKTNGDPGSMVLMIKGNVLAAPAPSLLTMDPKIERARKYPVEYHSLRFDNNFKKFGHVFHDTKDTLIFKVVNTASQPVAIHQFKNVPSFIVITPKKYSLEADEESEIMMVIDAGASGWYGEMNYSFYMLTSESQSDDQPLHINAHIVERFPKMNKKKMENAPKMYIDPVSYDLGNVLLGTTVKFEYEVTNIGKSNLIIRNITTICGCTVSAAEKKELKPGESTKVLAEFNTAGRYGEHEKKITVITNDPVRPEVDVTFKANIVENPNALDYKE